MLFRLVYLQLTLAKSRTHGYAHFSCEYLVNRENVAISVKLELPYAVMIYIFTFDLDHFE